MAKKIKKIKIKKLPKSIRKSSLRKGSFSQRVFLIIAKLLKETLKGIDKAGQAYIDLFCGFDTTSVIQKFYGTYYAQKEEQTFRERMRKEWQIKQALKNLHSMDYIKINKDGKKAYLTEKGALEFIRSRVQEKRPRWDGRWRIIVFDIPEEKRNQRDFLRRQLSWLGFKELQKSVWIFPYNIKKELEEVLTICKSDINGDIRFLTVERMEEDKDLRKEFKLI